MDNSTPLYKAAEMEDTLDLWFYHPLGFRIAKAAYPLGLTPNQVSCFSMLLGILGGGLLCRLNLAVVGYPLLIASSVLDSADGQLARMRGGGTVAGRVLDGLIGYFMFASAYVGLLFLHLSRPDSLGFWPMAALVALGGAATALQSSLYDYYRTTFASVVKKGVPPQDDPKEKLNPLLKFSYNSYHVYQNLFGRSHIRLMALLAEKFPGGLPAEVRSRYLEVNLPMIHRWNLFGDNTRLLGILVALLLNKPEWYFVFIIGPLSAGLGFMMWLQARRDAEFSKFINEGEWK